MKTEVYSWRVSAHRKAELEEEARRKGTSLSGLLQDITSEWLAEQHKHSDDADQQAAIRKRAASAIGAISGTDPALSSRARELVREIIARKHEKESNASRRSH